MNTRRRHTQRGDAMRGWRQKLEAHSYEPRTAKHCQEQSEARKRQGRNLPQNLQRDRDLAETLNEGLYPTES